VAVRISTLLKVMSVHFIWQCVLIARYLKWCLSNLCGSAY